MGEVYRATDTRLGRAGCHQVFRRAVQRAIRARAQAVAALNHPNICTLYDVAADYLVMELVEGPTLAERIAEGPISFDEAIDVAKQIAAGLEEAHDKGITHRDLKPGNIKIKTERHGEGARFWLREGHGDRTGSWLGNRFRQSHVLAHPLDCRDASRRHPRHRRLHVARAGQR